MLYSFFCVNPRLLKNNRAEIARVYNLEIPTYTTYEDGSDRVFRNVGT
jgi:hypothetical protein